MNTPLCGHSQKYKLNPHNFFNNNNWNVELNISLKAYVQGIVGKHYR